jgi:leader peptidase (prepilin peptidase)/N-methyltransferase
MVIVSFLAAIVQSWMTMRHTPQQPWPYPLIDWTWASAAIGGMIGVICSTAFLKFGVFRYSFADYEEYIEGDGALAEYPHARREVLKEFVVLLPILLGFIIGFMVGYEKGVPPITVQGIAGSFLGYLVGGGLVWFVRIFGTLSFGREAMGLGDVHLLAGIGAVIGWWDPIIIFFIAPFSGLLWAGMTALLEKIGKRYKEIPYGPHLAIATLIVVFCRPAVNWAWSIAMPSVHQLTTEKLQSNLVEVDLTNEAKTVSIHITPLPVGNGIEKQDVSLTLGEVL